MNMSDSERVRSVLDKLGYEHTENEEEATLVGIVACSVRQKAIDKVYTRIHKWNKWKNKKALVTFVTGCILPADRLKFLKLFDFVFPMSEIESLPEMIRQYGVTSIDNFADQLARPEINSTIPEPKPEPFIFSKKLKASELTNNINSFWNVTPSYQSSFEAFVPIQNGCDKFCTFCAVPYTRGREVSRPSDEILNEVKELVQQGYKSITLLGQNVNSYGLDKKGDEINFSQLLEKIGQFGNESTHDFWVYFTSPHPRDMNEDVIKVISRYKCLAKQIHIPIQSGDDNMLIKMNRKHSVETYRRIIHAIKKHIPEATIFTDIIVGFTGESDQQFENTRKVLKEFKYNMAYIAQYSPRPGAASSRWDDTVPKEVKKQRYHKLTDDLRSINAEYNSKQIGKVYKVLVRGNDRKTGYLSALTEGKLIVRFASENNSLIGQFVHLKIESATDFSMEGQLVDQKILAS